jgi:hypothetical protein
MAQPWKGSGHMADRETIIAHLNLYAVLQNTGDLLRLDSEMADLAKNWRITIQFMVKGGPAAWLEFIDGGCRHGRGQHPSPDVKLLFLSPAHLNKMFAGSGIPIPLKGFTKLGFLQKDFAKLTDRLEAYLKPEEGRLEEAAFRNINTELTLYTAIHAVRELALLEPTCKKVAASIPDGGLQVGVQPDGPWAHLVFKGGEISVGKGPLEKPDATMTFSDMASANALLTGQQDAFQAVAAEKVMLRGLIPIIDNVGLILDRVEEYLV